MHAQEASERADTHTCPTQKQVRHLSDILCGLMRAHDHRIAHAAAPKQVAQNRDVTKRVLEAAHGAGKGAVEQCGGSEAQNPFSFCV